MFENKFKRPIDYDKTDDYEMAIKNNSELFPIYVSYRYIVCVYGLVKVAEISAVLARNSPSGAYICNSFVKAKQIKFFCSGLRLSCATFCFEKF